MTELTRKASTIVADLQRFLAGGEPQYPNVARAHGWPNVDAVKRSIDALSPLGDLTVTFDVNDRKEPAVTTTPAPAPDPLSRILFNAHKHPRKSIRDLAARIETLLDRLEGDIEAERKKIAAARAKAEADAKVKDEIKRLEDRLRQLKAGRKGGGSGGPQTCDHEGCGREFDSVQAIKMHQRRTHQGYDPNAAKAAS